MVLKMLTREQRLRALHPNAQVPRVRVLPANDDLRRVLKHPITKMRFRPEGSVEWPLDTFTKRRLKEGSITIDESHPHTKQASEPKHRSHAHHQPRAENTE